MPESPLDLFLDWNSDLILTPSGSIQMATGWDRIRQRIIRRMITNPAETLPSGFSTPADYIFHPDYGIGLGSLVDQAESSGFLGALERRISKAVLEDDDVDSSAPPNILFQRPNPSTLWIIIGVTLVNGESGTIQIGTSAGA